MEKLIEPFSFNFAQLQSISTLLKHLNNNGKGVNDFIDFIKEEGKKRAIDGGFDKEKIKETKRNWSKITIECPKCKTTMGLYSVNTTPATQTGDDSRSVWICTNRDCMENIYNKQTVQEIIKEGGQNGIS